MVESKEYTEVLLDVFIEHYSTLIEALPVKSLIPKFLSARIITFSDQDDILKGDTPEEKALRFLRHIATPLTTGNAETFCKMLNVIEKHGGQYAYLAKNIKTDLMNYEETKQIMGQGTLYQFVRTIKGSIIASR